MMEVLQSVGCQNGTAFRSTPQVWPQVYPHPSLGSVALGTMAPCVDNVACGNVAIPASAYWTQ